MSDKAHLTAERISLPSTFHCKAPPSANDHRATHRARLCAMNRKVIVVTKCYRMSCNVISFLVELEFISAFSNAGGTYAFVI